MSAGPAGPPTPPPKWRRATELIQQLDREIPSYLDRAFEVVSDSGGNPPGIRVVESPPESLSLLLGDALQNLHAALDHEIHRQAAANMGAGWSGLERCAFPTFDDAADYAHQRKRLIGGLRPQVQAAIDRFQSCDADPEPAAAKLRLLNQLSRLDRHRLLHLTVLSLEDLGLRPRAPGQPDVESPLPPPPDDGALYLDVRMTVAVRFADGPAAGENIVLTLNDLTLVVAATIEKLRVVERRPHPAAKNSSE